MAGGTGSTKSATDPKLFHTPIHGMLNGRPVRILGTGDVEGNSPSYLVVNEQGKSSWESFNDVTITDTNYAPLSQQFLDNITTAAQQSARMSSGSSR